MYIAEYIFISVIFVCICISIYYFFQYVFRRKELEEEALKKEEKKKKEEAFGIKDLASQVSGGFKKVGSIIQKITKGFSTVGDSLGGSFKGVENTFKGFGEGMIMSFTNMGKLLKYTGLFVFSYLKCTLKFITNIFTYCVIFYMFDILKQVFYAPFRFIFWMISLSGVNIYKPVDDAWATIYSIDDSMYSAIGMSAFSYTKKIRNDCYNCRRMKQSTLTRVANEVNDSFNIKFPLSINKGKPDFDRAKRAIESLMHF